MRRLQSVLNAAVRLISNRSKFDRITHGSAPLASHPSAFRLRQQRPTWSRSDIHQLHMHSCPGGRRQGLPAICSSRRPRTHRFELRSFRVSGPVVWNLLSEDIRNSGTVAGAFQMYVQNTFISPSICLAALTELL